MPTSAVSSLPIAVFVGLAACAGSAAPPAKADTPEEKEEGTPSVVSADADRPSTSKTATFAEDFEWHGPASGVHVANVNGSIQIERASGSEVAVAATRSGPDADEVHVEMDKRGKEVFFRVVYPEARPGKKVRVGRHTVINNHNVDARVDFVLEVPAAVDVDAKTVNGEVTANVAASSLHLEAVNGRIDATGSGDVEASTVNGPVTVAVPKAHASRVELESVSGALSVHLPESVGATFDAKTLSGGIHSDFAIDNRKELVGAKARGKHGDGKVDIDLETVSGSIHIEKS